MPRYLITEVETHRFIITADNVEDAIAKIDDLDAVEDLGVTTDYTANIIEDGNEPT